MAVLDLFQIAPVTIFCNFFLSTGRREVFEMVCRNRGGLESMCDESGDYKCKCDNGYVYDSQTQTCRQIV